MALLCFWDNPMNAHDMIVVVVDDDDVKLITAGSLVTLSVVLMRSSFGDGGILDVGPESQQVRIVKVIATIANVFVHSYWVT